MSITGARFYASLVWISLVLIVGYKCYQVVASDLELLNVHFKTMDDIINGHP